MKKLLAIILCLTLCMGVLAITASAETTYTVAGCYLAPGVADTSDNEQAGVFSAKWAPAEAKNAMTSTGTNTYSITYANAPAGTYKFKVTDGTWTNSWGDNGGNVVVTLESACDLTINFDSSTETVTYEAASASAPTTITVHAKVPSSWTKANVYVWNGDNNNAWPGSAMTLGDDGWYTAEVPGWATSVIINNKTGDTGVQTGDMTLPDADEVWIVVDDSNNGTVHTSNPDAGTEPTPDPEPTGTITVHAKVPEGWTAASAYVWKADGTYDTAWPGAAMTLGDNGWYTITVPSWVENIIINDGKAEGALQTQDIKLTGADEIWIVVEANAEGGYTGTLTESAPATGDGSSLIAVCAGMLLAATAVTATVVSKKRFF